MKLPTIDEPTRYRGLYVVDFGDWTALGYTADEVAVLLESQAYQSGKVYKIVRAMPDGQMELRGVSAERFQFESGMLFNRASLEAAREDFAGLSQLGQSQGAPCRAFIHLADRGEAAQPARFVTALVYPAEYEDEMSNWLLEAGFEGGDMAEGGTSHVTNYYHEAETVLDKQQLWSQPAIPSRSPEDVLSSVRQAVQR